MLLNLVYECCVSSVGLSRLVKRNIHAPYGSRPTLIQSSRSTSSISNTDMSTVHPLHAALSTADQRVNVEDLR